MDLNEIQVFIQVIKEGSFSGAGKKLGLPNSTVSFKVSSLEKRLGVTLIQRTTRKISITPAGQVFFKRCQLGLEEIIGAEQEIVQIQKEPQGLLRLTAPTEFASSILPSILHDYSKRYPKARIELLLSDRILDLISENIDIAIRAGNLKDSSLVAKKIGSVHFILVASASYLKNSQPLNHPRELWHHACLQFTPMGYQEWRLTSGKGSLLVPIPGRIIINDLAAIKNLALAGAGIALLPSHYCYNEIRNEKLIQVLPEWQSKGTDLHFVYPAQRFVTPKLSEFIKLADKAMKSIITQV